MSSINFLLDVDNAKRYTIRKSKLNDEIKEAIKEFKLGSRFHFDIKGLGVLQVDAVFPSLAQRSLVIKSTLLVDYAEREEGDGQ